MDKLLITINHNLGTNNYVCAELSDFHHFLLGFKGQTIKIVDVQRMNYPEVK